MVVNLEPNKMVFKKDRVTQTWLSAIFAITFFLIAFLIVFLGSFSDVLYGSTGAVFNYIKSLTFIPTITVLGSIASYYIYKLIKTRVFQWSPVKVFSIVIISFFFACLFVIALVSIQILSGFLIDPVFIRFLNSMTIFLIFDSIAFGLFLCFKFFKDKVFEWTLDKTSGEIRYERTSPSRKFLKTFDLNSIEKVILHKTFPFHLFPPTDFSIVLQLKTKKRIYLFSSPPSYTFFPPRTYLAECANICIQQGQTVGKFLGKSLIYTRKLKQALYVLFTLIILLLILGIYLLTINWFGGILLLSFNLIYSLFSSIKLGREYLHSKIIEEKLDDLVEIH